MSTDSHMTIKQVGDSDKLSLTPSLFICRVHPLDLDAATIPFRRVLDSLTVGREPAETPAFTVDDGTVSRGHFKIVRNKSRWRLDDLDSANGTYVNGRKTMSAYVDNQDVIRVGNTVFVLTSRCPEDLSWLREYGIVAASHAMARVVNTVRQEVESDANVLLLGETGTGKDLVSSLIHRLSGRTGRFVAVNCAAIPEALLESTLFGSVKGAYTGSVEDTEGLLLGAQGGTFLLDEVGELAPRMQAKLMRAIEDRQVIPVGSAEQIPFKVKLVAATNNVKALRQGDSGFRQDLLARLEDVVLLMPPLRHRKEEIALLLAWILAGIRGDSRPLPTPKFVETLLLYSWPRNVRQLVKVVKTAVRSSPHGQPLHRSTLIEPLNWEASVRGSGVSGDTGKTGPRKRRGVSEPPDGTESEAVVSDRRWHTPPARQEVEWALDAFQNNIAAVARHFGCHRKQVYRWLEMLDIRR